MYEVLSVACGGAVGALCRFEVGRLCAGSRFPLGTLAVNVLGSFLMGLLAGGLLQSVHPLWQRAVLDGFLGALTTFSSFSIETGRLLLAGDIWQAGLYVGLSLTLGLGGAAMGWFL